MGDLGTTNVILGVIATVTVLEGACVITLIAVLALLFRRVDQMLRRIEVQQLAPAVGRVNAILDDVKEVSSTVKEDAGRLHAFATWIVTFLPRGRV